MHPLIFNYIHAHAFNLKDEIWVVKERQQKEPISGLEIDLLNFKV